LAACTFQVVAWTGLILIWMGFEVADVGGVEDLLEEQVVVDVALVRV
jgi:hypothetical protein